MDLRLTFNEVSEDYGRLRPHYPDALSSDLIKYSKLNATKKALEIGIGAGQATLPFLKTGCELKAVEIGDNLARYSREKFVSYERFTVLNQDFESALLDEDSFDLIYSASAFHWINPEIGFPKVCRLLKNGSVFAWISVQPAPAHKHMHDELEEVYEKFNRYFSVGKLEFDRFPEVQRKQSDRVNSFKQYGFIEIVDKIYHGTRTLNASDYATICGTYSDHRAIPEADRSLLLSEIEAAVNRCGGTFTFVDTFLLCMGRKP
ncbi:MAG: class I SAM-dependent methyltransferase [Saccharofermentanales bacterium]